MKTISSRVPNIPPPSHLVLCLRQHEHGLVREEVLLREVVPGEVRLFQRLMPTLVGAQGGQVVRVAHGEGALAPGKKENENVWLGPIPQNAKADESTTLYSIHKVLTKIQTTFQKMSVGHFGRETKVFINQRRMVISLKN